jgi:hypothetical protein
MRAESVSIEPYGDIAVNLASFKRALEAANLSPRTIQLAACDPPTTRVAAPSNIFPPLSASRKERRDHALCHELPIDAQRPALTNHEQFVQLG